VNTELVVPVNQPLVLNMTATDVIHSFWVPEWRIKQDLVPGMTTHVNYVPKLTGTFRLACNQACGLSHTAMYANVQVVTEEEFTAWLNEQAVVQGIQPSQQAALDQQTANN
jgi:cytochrome c oxidase subunit 2